MITIKEFFKYENANAIEVTWIETKQENFIKKEIVDDKEIETIDTKIIERIIHCQAFSDSQIDLLRQTAKDFNTPISEEQEKIIKGVISNIVLPTKEEQAEIVLESRKQEYQTKLLHINAEYDLAIANLSRGVPDTERSTWTKQEQEAKEVIAGNINVPMLSALATAREIPLEYLASKVIEKASLYATIVGQLTGTRQREEDALKLEYKDIL